MITKKYLATAVASTSCALLALASIAGVASGSSEAYANDKTEDGYEIVIGEPKAISYLGNYEGYANVNDWEAAQANKLDTAKSILDNSLTKIGERNDVNWREIQNDIADLRDDIDASWNVETARIAVEDAKQIDKKVVKAIKDRDEEIEAERIAAEEEAARIAAEEASAAVYYYGGGGDYSYQSGDGVLTRAGGVNEYNGRHETWYSQRVLPGGGLDIPGRHVADDGTIRDSDNYIVVAASDLDYGSVVDTSLGAGKVYDSGCDAGTTDIYTDW